MASNVPADAETTIRYEMLCQGVQDAEAHIVLSDAIANHADHIGKDLAERARQILVDRLCHLRSRGQSAYHKFMPRCNHSGWTELDRRLFAAAAEVTRRLGR